jgi:FAD:protein FMN transferase
MLRCLSLLFVSLACLAAIWALRPRDDDQQAYHETLYVFGTLVEIVIRDEPHDKARAAVAEISEKFDQIHRDWHAWKPGGELYVLNQSISRGEGAHVGEELAGLLQEAKTLAVDSDGLFEPAIGGLIGEWGFHADEPPTGSPPTPAAIRRWVNAHPRMGDLTIKDGMVTSANVSVRLDLGGFAKGAALDLATRMLKKRGIENAVLNAGGDLNVLGMHGERAWRVAIRDPFGWGAIAAVNMRPGEVLYTSGNYERYLEHDGQRFSHIIDPRTGKPVREIVSVSVLHRNGAYADAAATALSVAGRKDWLRVARKMGISSALLIDEKGALYMTPEMSERVELLQAPSSITVADPTIPLLEVGKQAAPAL